MTRKYFKGFILCINLKRKSKLWDDCEFENERDCISI